MSVDLESLYRMMLRSRLFEEHVMRLWKKGLIPGEMHMGIGEEGVIAGITAHLQKNDTVALDHRGTALMVMRGEDLSLLLKEFMGLPDGLCRGQGGHMHLFSHKYLDASSGIVGASGPAAAGFALAHDFNNSDALAVAFFGEAAMNQGMLMESMNLSAAWNLPVLFVCKNNGLSITTESEKMTGGSLVERAHGLGLTVYNVDGARVEDVWDITEQIVSKIRAGEGPAFLLARCDHFEGHFLGDGLLRILRHPLRESKNLSGEVINAVIKNKGDSKGQRLANLGKITGAINLARLEQKRRKQDPLLLARNRLKENAADIKTIETEVETEISSVVESVLAASPQKEGPVR